MTAPPELAGLLAAVHEQLEPLEIWLFGSRARGTCGPDSDWDLLVVVPDDATPDVAENPTLTWRIARDSGVPSTVLATRQSDLEDIWGQVNTLGYDLAREGIRLDVR
ncbi:MAG: nucleotidyltransferase domain-containing protein [Rhizobiales bacterium]|nr:nucleotidyltransferase domain-containing protein [Hyphomicrobiales bacterium]